MLPEPPASAVKPPRLLTGRHVLVMLLGFFAVISAANIVMMALAIRTMPGIEVASPFEESQRFNQRLARIAEQDQLGWRVDVRLGEPRGGAALSVDLRDRAGAPITGARVTGRIGRPTDGRFDREIAFADHGGGRYGARLPDLAAGQWQVTLEVVRDGETRFISQDRLILKD